MGEPAPQPDLLRSLGRLIRGLTAIFWGLPLAMICTTQEYLSLWTQTLGVVLPLVVTSLVFYGLMLMGSFQKQERIWIAALDRAKFVALTLVGLSPFVYWRTQVPSEPYFTTAITVFFGVGVLLLYALNVVLFRLAAMLPDETLRADARTFTSLNRGVLLAIMVMAVALQAFSYLETPPEIVRDALLLIEVDRQWLLMAVVLFPVAVTMTLLWKIKEAVLASVFSGSH